MSATHAVSIADVDKKFGTRSGDVVTALTGVSLAIDPGQFVCVVGPSGCGKSTLLRIVGGLDRPSSGSVHVDGTPVEGARRDTAFVFQRPLLLDWMTVRNNVLVPARIQGGRIAKETIARADALLELVGLADFGKVLPRQLSGGMQQRASIARALLQDPTLLLLDEPFGSLDAITREQLNLELLRIWSRSLEESVQHGRPPKTVVMVTHDIAEAVFLADVIYVMSRRPGQILSRIEVPLTRPRAPHMTVEVEFTKTAERVRQALYGDEVVATSAEGQP